MDDAIRQYMATIGKRGGSAKTEAQIDAHRRALDIARRSRWPQKKVENILPSENVESSTTKKDVDK